MPGDRPLHRHPHHPILTTVKSTIGARPLLRRFGAHGVGVRRKYRNGRATDSLALTFYVTEKANQDDLHPSSRIPGSVAELIRDHFGRATDIVGRLGRRRLLTDVVVRSPALYQPAGGRKPNSKPFAGGASIGIDRGTSSRDRFTVGTLGGWVKDRTDNEIVMLSNQHIFPTRKTMVIQPSPFGGIKKEVAGSVKRAVRVKKGRTATNRSDCAIASPVSSGLERLEVKGIGPGPHAALDGRIHLEVQKSGAGSGVTKGVITDASWSGLIEGEHWDDLLMIDPPSKRGCWSEPGDSGSLVFARSSVSGQPGVMPVVGLHCAGNTDDGYGLACRFEYVMEDLDIALIPKPRGKRSGSRKRKRSR